MKRTAELIATSAAMVACLQAPAVASFVTVAPESVDVWAVDLVPAAVHDHDRSGWADEDGSYWGWGV